MTFMDHCHHCDYYYMEVLALTQELLSEQMQRCQARTITIQSQEPASASKNLQKLPQEVLKCPVAGDHGWRPNLPLVHMDTLAHSTPAILWFRRNEGRERSLHPSLPRSAVPHKTFQSCCILEIPGEPEEPSLPGPFPPQLSQTL